MTRYTLEDIDTLAFEYAESRQMLGDQVKLMEEETNAIRKKYRKAVRRQLGNTVNAKAALKAVIEASPQLFDKPKTKVLHGVKVGLRKQKGKLTYQDEEALLKRIRKNYDDPNGVLIKVTHKPIKSALEKLPDNELKVLGCEIKQVSDQVVIDEVATELDELIDAILHDDEFAIEVCDA